MSADDGWRKPPRTQTGQFAKGVSGNCRGRPRKAERAFTHSQVRRDILGLMEESVEIKVQGKIRRMPLILAVYWRMMMKALEGSERMLLAVIELRRQLTSEHREGNPGLIESLELFEQKLAHDGDASAPDIAAILNDFRKRTRGV